MTPTATRDPRVDPYRAAIEDGIKSRLQDRRWYRARAWTIGWPSREENEVVLRALLRIRRETRALVDAAPDPIDVYRGWIESELREAHGGR